MTFANASSMGRSVPAFASTALTEGSSASESPGASTASFFREIRIELFVSTSVSFGTPSPMGADEERAISLPREVISS